MTKNGVLIDFEKSLGPWLSNTMKLVDCYVQESFDNYQLDITKEQMIVLKRLHEQDGINQNLLASQTFRDKSSLARLLSKMEAKEYIQRRQGTVDKRNKRVYLTDRGKSVFSRTRPIIKQVMETMERNITQPDKEQVIKALRQIQGNITEEIATK